jgi:SHS2 domain-containing protein
MKISNGVKKYEILEHKADLKIRAFGKDKKELFENTMIGMFKSAKYEEENGEIKREIKVFSQDLPSLLVDFLSEVLYLSEVNHQVYHRIQFKEFSDKKIKGVLIGKPLKRIGVEIKGVTHHDLQVYQKKDKTWQATVLFDI